MNGVKEGYFNKIRNKLFGLLCEFEKGRDWEKFLDAILIELYGWPEEDKTINYLSLCNKLSAARYLNYECFRKTIFDCMGLVGKIDEQV